MAKGDSMTIPWKAFQDEALDCLRALIRLDTTNPPGNERIAADYIADALAVHGVESVIRESAPTRASLIARHPGTDSSKGALLLSSHTDVVPVERSGWTREPFSGEIADGCVWGRGAIDMKSKCATDLVLMTALKRAGAKPDRDVIMAAVADEEAGSDYGAKFLVERHPELVRASYVLNEVGGFTIHLRNRRFYPIQIAEKGFVTIKMKVTAMPGHGSMPRSDTAISRIAELITKIVKTPMRKNVSPFMRKTLEELGVPVDSAGPLFQPMLANTVSPTILRAGYKDNVIPGEATIVLDGRTLPGEDPESFMAELREIVGPEPTFELIKTAPPAETSPDTPLFELIKDTIEAADPGSRAIPWMIPGATDNKFYSKLGAACYGFSPVRLEPHMPFGSLYHGNDERLPIEGFNWGLKVYAEVVLKFLGIKFDDVFA
ncbi:MAG TPA: M20/M25/M40 family metallo-hydrolase [Candidatus Dormibacteraeota bacterium]|nr:M20/M25/M40 family metallo-hydrolase [Candidatus Dormibacteraeota bacterium]